MTELPYSTWSGAAPGSWLARWLSACADLEELFAHHHLLDAIIEEIDGRRIRVGERWLIDFASCNYLGLDLDREVIEAIPAFLDRWGTHPSWSRMLGSPALYRQIETRLTELLGAADSLLLPTLTHIHASVIPVLASDGTIFVDARAHKTIWDGCVAARAHGATVVRYAHDDPEALERLLHRHPKAPRLVCMDGINSMTGNPPDLPAFLALARANDALLYVDDAHGFGVVGERDRSEISPFGRRGNGVVRHVGERHDHVVLTGGFSKAYSSLPAFIACPPELKRLLKVTAPPYLYSGPSPVASLASVLVGLQVNEARGDELRAVLWARTKRILDHLDKLGAFTLNRSGFPIVEVPLADPDDLARAGRFLLDRGIYVTLAFYPGVPREEVGFRIQVTAANTDDEVSELLTALDQLADVVPLRAVQGTRGSSRPCHGLSRQQPGKGPSPAWMVPLRAGRSWSSGSPSRPPPAGPGAGVRAVLAGEASLFRCRYQAPDGTRPYEVTVTPLAEGDGAVVSHRPPPPAVS